MKFKAIYLDISILLTLQQARKKILNLFHQFEKLCSLEEHYQCVIMTEQSEIQLCYALHGIKPILPLGLLIKGNQPHPIHTIPKPISMNLPNFTATNATIACKYHILLVPNFQVNLMCLSSLFSTSNCLLILIYYILNPNVFYLGQTHQGPHWYG